MKTNAEIQREFRRRKNDCGEKEIRGIYARKEYHRKIKQDVKDQIRRLQESDNDL